MGIAPAEFMIKLKGNIISRASNLGSLKNSAANGALNTTRPESTTLHMVLIHSAVIAASSMSVL